MLDEVERAIARLTGDPARGKASRSRMEDAFEDSLMPDNAGVAKGNDAALDKAWAEGYPGSNVGFSVPADYAKIALAQGVPAVQ